MNTGICSSIGRQPPIGLNPCSRWSFCISCAWRCLSLAYFFWIFFISGANCCIARIERTCFTNGLNMIARRVKTRNMMPSAQAIPLESPKTCPNTQCQHHRMKDTG